MKWAKLKEDRKFELARLPFFICGASVFTPTEAQYRERGYLPFVDERPTEEGCVFAPLDTARLLSGIIYREYERKELPPPAPPVTRYSGWKMYKAIKAEGYGEAFNELMKNNIEVMIAFVRPQYFLSDDADFTAMVTQMCAALHIDDETKERILAASVDEEVA